MAAAEWMADPDGDPSTADFPTVVNASWGAERGGRGAAPDHRALARARDRAGLRGGKHRRSVAAPAIYPESLAVGAVGPRGGSRASRAASRAIAGQAGTVMGVRLPPRRASPISPAPGSRRLRAARGAWASLSGTSMAAPHGLRDDRARAARPTPPSAPPPSSPSSGARRASQARGRRRRGGAGAVDARAAGSGARRAPAAAGDLADRGAPGRDQRRRPDPPSRAAARRLACGSTAPACRTPARPLRAAAGGHARATRSPSPRSTRAAPRSAPVGRSFGSRSIASGPGWPWRFAAAACSRSASAPGWGRSRVCRMGPSGADQREPELLGGPTAKVTFTCAGPYWVEAEAADRRATSGASGASSHGRRGPSADGLAWNDALVTLRMPFIMARRHRRFDGHYRPRARLARSWRPTASLVFVAMPTPTCGPRGAVGVWSDAHEDAPLDRAGGPPLRHGGPDGRLSRGVLSAPES